MKCPWPKLSVGFAFLLIVGCGTQHKVEELLKHGDEAQQNENYEQAIKDYTEAIRLNPKLALAYFHRGSVLVMNGDFEKAIDDLNVAVRLDSKNAFAYETRGHAYL